MSLHRIPLGVRRFIAERILSVTQLELLLILHRDPSVSWTPEELGREMRLPAAWAAMHLERFTAQGLLARSGRPHPRFRYEPDSTSAAVVDEVAETFRRRRTSMTALIFAPSRHDVSLLSHALRRRRDEAD